LIDVASRMPESRDGILGPLSQIRGLSPTGKRYTGRPSSISPSFTARMCFESDMRAATDRHISQAYPAAYACLFNKLDKLLCRLGPCRVSSCRSNTPSYPRVASLAYRAYVERQRQGPVARFDLVRWVPRCTTWRFSGLCFLGKSLSVLHWLQLCEGASSLFIPLGGLIFVLFHHFHCTVLSPRCPSFLLPTSR
jgi:hypothetical protein